MEAGSVSGRQPSSGWGMEVPVWAIPQEGGKPGRPPTYTLPQEEPGMVGEQSSHQTKVLGFVM